MQLLDFKYCLPWTSRYETILGCLASSAQYHHHSCVAKQDWEADSDSGQHMDAVQSCT